MAAEYPDSEVSFALIDVSVETAKLILLRRCRFLQLQEVDRDAQSLHCCNCDVTWLTEDIRERSTAFDTLLDVACESGYVSVDPEFSLPNLRFASGVLLTDADTVVITKDGFYWQAYPKGSDYLLETNVLPYNILEPLLEPDER